MKALVINLERAAQRREFMQKQLTKRRLDYNIIEGVDYKALSDNDYEEHCSAKAIGGDSYIRGVFAASLSHLRICSTIVENDLPCALVLEDDVILPINIAELLADLGSRCFGDSIYLLHYYSHRDRPLALSRHDSINCGMYGELLAPVEIAPVASAAAYVVTQSAAERMLAELRPVDHVPDNWGLFYAKGVFRRLFCLHPRVVRDAPFVPLVEYPATKKLASRIKTSVRRVGFINDMFGILRAKHASERYRVALTDERPFWSRDNNSSASVNH